MCVCVQNAHPTPAFLHGNANPKGHKLMKNDNNLAKNVNKNGPFERKLLTFSLMFWTKMMKTVNFFATILAKLLTFWTAWLATKP